MFISGCAAQSLSSPGSLMCNRLRAGLRSALLGLCWEPWWRGPQPNTWTHEVKKQHSHPWSWPLLGRAGAFWQAVLGTWCCQTLFCTWQEKPSSGLGTMCKYPAPCQCMEGPCLVAAGHPQQLQGGCDIAGTSLNPMESVYNWVDSLWLCFHTSKKTWRGWMIQQLCLEGTAEWVPGARDPHPAGGTGTVVGELLPPISACPWQQQHQLVSLPPTAAEISVNQSYRVELSQSQGKALALIHQLKMSKAFEPDWNLPKTNKQTKMLSQILVVFLLDFSEIIHCIFIYFPDFFLFFFFRPDYINVSLYRCIF